MKPHLALGSPEELPEGYVDTEAETKALDRAAVSKGQSTPYSKWKPRAIRVH